MSASELKDDADSDRWDGREAGGRARGTREFVADRARSLRGCSRLCGPLRAERALTLALALAAACASEPSGPAPIEVVPGAIDERWQVLDPDGEVLGYVARTRYRFSTGEHHRFIVENAHFQDVGFIDENGRAYRERPFDDAPEFVGIGSLEEGLERLYRARGAVRLQPLPASFHPSLDR